jgi:hypothetical protein
LGVTGAYRFYRLQGYDGAWSIGFKMPLETGLTVVVSYVSKNWIRNPTVPAWIDGGDSIADTWIENPEFAKDSFTSGDDVCLLPRRLVEAGIVWRFRRRKALPYQDVLAEYEILMARTLSDTRTRRKIDFSGRPVLRSPFDIPIPDFIPPS